MLSEQEVNNIFSWLPYKDGWTVDRNQVDDNIEGYYGDLIKELTGNHSFETFYSKDGGLSNYLEFICYPTGHGTYDANAILVCISLCSPIAAYGQTTFTNTVNSWSWAFIKPEKVGAISDPNLINMQSEIEKILRKYKLDLVEKEFACRLLPKKVLEELKYENHNQGDQYLHGLFQVTD